MPPTLWMLVMAWVEQKYNRTKMKQKARTNLFENKSTYIAFFIETHSIPNGKWKITALKL
jgi:hypothetical protein